MPKRYKSDKIEAQPLYGTLVHPDDRRNGNGHELPLGIEYEPDSELHDTEQIPPVELGVAFSATKCCRTCARIDPDSSRIGYEISFRRSKPQLLRSKKFGQTFLHWNKEPKDYLLISQAEGWYGTRTYDRSCNRT